MILLSACFAFDVDDIASELESDERFTLIENVLPVATGFAWVCLFGYRDAPEDVHAAVGTSVLLCLPALVRIDGAELRAAVDALHSSAWVVLFLVQPLLKFLCVYAWVLALSLRRARVVIASMVLCLAVLTHGRCVLGPGAEGIFFASVGLVVLIELVAAGQAPRGASGRLSA